MHNFSGTKIRFLAFAVLICAVSGFCNVYSIFESRDNSGGIMQRGDPVLPLAVSYYRSVALNTAFSQPQKIDVGDVLEFEGFDGFLYSAVVDRIEQDINGTAAIRARIDGFEMGYVLISTSEGKSLGTIKIPELGIKHSISYCQATNSHYYGDVDRRALDWYESSPPLISPIDKELESIQTQGVMLNQPYEQVEVDVMIVYTQAAENWAHRVGGINNQIAQAMAKAQLTLDSSDVFITLNLVYSSVVYYTESGSAGTDLTRLTNTDDGYMDEVHLLRDQYGADLVCLFALLTGEGGTAWLLNTYQGNPDRGFSIVRVQQASTHYTFMHELGHNFGAHHHKEQNHQPGPNNSLNTYSAGWRWVGNDGLRYCSVMSYAEGQYFDDNLTHNQVAYFSNPNVLHQGVAAGHPAHGDNARTLRDTKSAVSMYRQAPPQSTYSLNISLVPGWNWISFNVLPVNRAIESVFFGYAADDGDIVLAADGKNATYFQGQWYGMLKDIEPGLKYRLSSKSGANFAVEGYYVSPYTQIQLVSGWNWLGYSLENPQPIETALAGLEANDGDVILSQNGLNKTYFDGSWYGTLEFLLPGKGYLLKVEKSQTFSYSN